MKSKYTILVMLALTVFNSSLTFAGKSIDEESLRSIFKKYGVEGSILIYNDRDNEYIGCNLDRCYESFSPASTFKIPNSLIALETGVVTMDSIFKWDGEKRALSAWEADLNLAEAYRVSCVPVFQGIAQSIGVERMQKYVKLLDFGNMIVREDNINSFWLENESRITQYQQIYFLKRLHDLELPVSREAMLTMREIMLWEFSDYYQLYAKTGWDVSGETANGWFVGYIEIEDNVYYFATNIGNIDKAETSKYNDARINITKEAFKYLNVINPDLHRSLF